MLPPVPAEFIGVGPFWSGEAEPDGPIAWPRPFPRGAAMGQHLAVERLIRVTEDRLVYLVNNLSRKWSRRMCWACGNKFSESTAQSCDYCGRKLEDLRFLMTARWAKELHHGFEELTKARVRHFGLVSPVYAFYRQGLLMAVYHYDGAALLIDVPSPLPTTQILKAAIQLSETLAWLHESGVVLRPFRASNVLLMPDGSPRLFDLDAEEVLPKARDVYRDPRQPALRDTRNLARLLLQYAQPEDEPLVMLLEKVAEGNLPGPLPFKQLAKRLLDEHVAHARVLPTSPAAAWSDVGLYRARNEDAWAWRKLGDRLSIYAVADGMGTNEHGRAAAEIGLATLTKWIAENVDVHKADPAAIQKALQAAYSHANSAVFVERKRRDADMGATLTTAVLVDSKHLFVAHAGDSAVFLLQEKKLRRLTEEHNVAAELLAEKKITAEEYKTHKSRNILTSVLGAEGSLDRVDVQHVQVKPGDRVLVCSDGLYREVPEDHLQRHLVEWNDRQKAVRELVRECYTRGGHDNVTVLVVDVV